MRFSVITVTLNAADVIGKTVESVLIQQFYDLEYVFIDGGSQDETNRIIDRYQPVLEEKGISVIHISEKDRGISDAFAKGVRNASGEIIAILNAGDEMLPGTLAFLNDHFGDAVDVLYGNVIWHDEARQLEYIKKSKKPEHLAELKYNMVVQHPATYIRKSAYERYGNYDPDYLYAMDAELLLRMVCAGAVFQYIDREFTMFQAGGSSDTHLMEVLKAHAAIAGENGEKPVQIYFHLTKKVIFHHLAHFIRFHFMKKKKERNN